MKYTPVLARPLNGGTQVIFRFANNYGASVVKHEFSYGSKQGLAELAIICWKQGEENILEFELTYDTPITDDVLGHLTFEEVKGFLYRISQLPPYVKALT